MHLYKATLPAGRAAARGWRRQRRQPSRVAAFTSNLNWRRMRCLGGHDERGHQVRLADGDILRLRVCTVCGRINPHVRRQITEDSTP